MNVGCNEVKFLITGSPGSGKSTLIRRLVESLGWRTAGYCTWPYQIENELRGYYLHSLTDIPDQLNDLPISVRQTPQTSIGIGDTFRTLGTKCLLQSLHAQADCIILDEIGRFEQKESDFIKALQAVLDQKQKPVFAAIKKEPLSFVNELLARPDCILIDLDTTDREKAFRIVSDTVRASESEQRKRVDP